MTDNFEYVSVSKHQLGVQCHYAPRHLNPTMRSFYALLEAPKKYFNVSFDGFSNVKFRVSNVVIIHAHLKKTLSLSLSLSLSFTLSWWQPRRFRLCLYHVKWSAFKRSEICLLVSKSLWISFSVLISPFFCLSFFLSVSLRIYLTIFLGYCLSVFLSSCLCLLGFLSFFFSETPFEIATLFTVLALFLTRLSLYVLIHSFCLPRNLYSDEQSWYYIIFFLLMLPLFVCFLLCFACTSVCAFIFLSAVFASV